MNLKYKNSYTMEINTPVEKNITRGLIFIKPNNQLDADQGCSTQP
jgi:hypothetical protein